MLNHKNLLCFNEYVNSRNELSLPFRKQLLPRSMLDNLEICLGFMASNPFLTPISQVTE